LRTDQAPALTLVQLRSIIDALPLMPAVPEDKGYLAYLRDLRDRAFILTGIVGGFRQSELSQLTVDQGKAIEGGAGVYARHHQNRRKCNDRH